MKGANEKMLGIVSDMLSGKKDPKPALPPAARLELSLWDLTVAMRPLVAAYTASLEAKKMAETTYARTTEAHRMNYIALHEFENQMLALQKISGMQPDPSEFKTLTAEDLGFENDEGA